MAGTNYCNTAIPHWRGASICKKPNCNTTRHYFSSQFVFYANSCWNVWQEYEVEERVEEAIWEHCGAGVVVASEWVVLAGRMRCWGVRWGSGGFRGVQWGDRWGVATKTGIALISLEPPLPLPFIVPAEWSTHVCLCQLGDMRKNFGLREFSLDFTWNVKISKMKTERTFCSVYASSGRSLVWRDDCGNFD